MTGTGVLAAHRTGVARRQALSLLIRGGYEDHDELRSTEYLV